LSEGISDPHVVAVAFAGGTESAPTTIFAATATGRLFWAAADAEMLNARWQEIVAWAGLGIAVVLAPSPDYANDNTLFVGTPNGIFRTLDGGQSWESCNFGLLDEDALCMVCAPDFATSEVLWAGTAGGGLYRSRNRARAWRESGMGLPDAAVQCLAVSPHFATDRTLYVGMEEHGIYISRDGGENWQSFALVGQNVNALACADADSLWAGTEDGLWRVTTSNGQAVQCTGAGEAVLSVAATAAGHVAAGSYGGGLWLTTQGDELIAQWHKPTVALHAPPVVVRVGSELFALDADSLLAHSPDGGATWNEMPPTDGATFALAGAQDTSAPEEQVLLAATGAGLLRWHAGEWEALHAARVEAQMPLGVALSPAYAHDRTLLMTAQRGEVWLSQDGGATWQSVGGPWRGQTLLHACFAPQRAHELLILSVQPNEVGHFGVSVWHSADLGQSWDGVAQFTTAVPVSLVAWQQDTQQQHGGEQTLFLATQHRVIKLFVDKNFSFWQLHQHFFDEGTRITALAVALEPAQSTVWAATTSDLYCSHDGGVQWTQQGGVPDALPVVWLDASPANLLAITLGGRVWRAALA
jgi:hypothetical protein